MKGKRGLVGRDSIADDVAPRGRFRDRVTAAANDQGVELSKPAEIEEADAEESKKQKKAQKELIPGSDKPVVPSPVRGNLMMASYVKPHYFLVKDDRKVGLEMSFPLTDDHRGVLPKSVCDEWQHLKKSNSTRVCLDVPEQTVDIRFAPDHDVELHLSGAQIHKATLSVIQEKGTGAAKKVVRFSFRIVSDVMRNVCGFADHEFGKTIWLEMFPTQRELDGY